MFEYVGAQKLVEYIRGRLRERADQNLLQTEGETRERFVAAALLSHEERHELFFRLLQLDDERGESVSDRVSLSPRVKRIERAFGLANEHVRQILNLLFGCPLLVSSVGPEELGEPAHFAEAIVEKR